MIKNQNLLRIAETDLKASELLLNSSNDELMQNTAAYHSQQAVEKVMKAIKLEHGEAATVTHNIATLRKDLADLGVTVPEWVQENEDDITSWATTIRYNSNFKSDHDLIEKINQSVREWIDALVRSETSETV